MSARRYRWDNGLRARVLGLVIFLLALLVGLGSALSYTFHRLNQLQQRTEKTRESIQRMEHALGTFAEMTSALRGYLVVGQEQFLEPYNTGKTRFELTMQELIVAAAGDPLQLSRVHKVNDLVLNWVSSVAEPEIRAKRSRSPEAGELIANGSGPHYIGEVRRAGEAYMTRENERLLQEISFYSAATRNVQIVTWAGVSVAAMLALGGFLIFARSLTKATGALATAANRIANGERGVVVEAELEGELLEVAEAFTSMSMTLTAQEEELQAQQEELIAQNEELMAQQEELQSRAEQLEQHDQRLSRLNRVGEAIIGTIEMGQLSEMILDEYLGLYGGSAGVLLLADQHSEQFQVQAERWLSPDWRNVKLRPAGPLARCVDRAEVVTARYPETISRISVWQSEVPVVQEIYIPLLHTTRVIAVVVIASTESFTPSAEANALWNGIARQAAVALAAAVSHQEVKWALQTLQEQAAQVEELNAQLEEERDRASAQLDIYLSIVSTMRSGAWLTDTGGNLLVVNNTFREFFGHVPEAATLDSVLAQIAALLPPEDSFQHAARELVYSRGGHAEGTVQLSTGYTLQWSSAPVGSEQDLVGRLFTFQDITELAKLDRLKSEFVQTVSHELRTPLTSIMGYLSLVLNEQVGPLQAQQKEFLQVVSRNTDRLGNLINDLLDVQRIESGRAPLQRRPVQVTDIVRHVAETFRVAAEQKGLAFHLELPRQDLPLISADPDRLTQIASNLVSNAVKYTREGHVRVVVDRDERWTYLRISDSGVGITPAEQKRIFEKFFRCDNKYARDAGGTGLGLAIVKMLVEEHGGEIRVESEPGKGSTFIVALPL